MSATDAIITLTGLLVVAAALREVFHTLLHPSGVGQLTPAVFRAVWRTAHRVGGRATALAGPSAVLASIVIWTLMVVIGWALVYWPQMPEGFEAAAGIRAPDDLLDAIYVSGTALSTLGFGDIVAEPPALRIAFVVESLVGFGLLTASISWVLSINPALVRRRALAARINALVSADSNHPRLVGGDPPCVQAIVLHSLSEQLQTARVDLVQYPTSYYFADPAPEVALRPALPRLRTAVTRDDIPPEAQTAATAVCKSIDALSQTLRRRPFSFDADDAPAECS